MSDTDAILQSEYDRIQSSDDWYAYLGTILRNMPGGASVKMLTKEMRSLCSDPNRQIKYNPFRANDWDFALNSCVVNFRLFGNRFVFCMSKKDSTFLISWQSTLSMWLKVCPETALVWESNNGNAKERQKSSYNTKECTSNTTKENTTKDIHANSSRAKHWNC